MNATEVPEVDLSAKALLAAAQHETGLTDWGDTAFHEPLSLYLKSIEAHAGMHALGRVVLWKILMRLLTNRLQMQRDFTAHPEILETPIAKPLFIIGLPRTGTTLLHNLLACDPAARSIKLWQGIFPSPPPETATLETDPRIAATTELIAGFNQMAPRLATAHNLVPQGPEECLWLIEHTFVDFIHELRAHVPEYSEWLLKHEADSDIYSAHRRMLQLLAWKTDGDHWVLKAPRHLFGLRGLLEIYPDACIVQTHREPKQVLPSVCSLCEIDRAIFTENPDRQLIGDHWFARLQHGFESAIAVREQDTTERYIDVDYRQLVADPFGVVRQIYETHGYAYTAAFEEAMRAWLESNRQHKHGVHRYSLDDYGLDAEEIDRGFAAYRERFSAVLG